MGTQDRVVERAFHAGFELAVDEGIGESRRGFGTGSIDNADQLDRGFRQRAGLVGAQDVHGPHIVNRGQPLHDDLLLRHPHRRARERDRDDHRQQFGRQPDRERHREQQRLKYRPMEVDVHDQNEQHHQYGKSHDQHAESADTDGEGGGRRFLRQAGREMAKRRPAAGSTDDNRRRAADHRGAGEHGVGGAGWIFRARRGIAGLLFRRIRLPGQQSLIDVEIAAFQQP
jgi:hypothetical protein